MAAKPSVVITGASTGIGWGAVKVLLAGGWEVYGSVRKQADAERLQAEFGSAFTPLLMDVTDRPAVERAAALVGERLGTRTLAGLVNNAGVAVTGPLLHLPLDKFRHQLEVNLVGALSVTQAFAPLLGADRKRGGRPGRIVNISSVGGRIAAPFLGAYAASKHGLEGMSESLRRELMLYGIDVIIIAPGSVVTPIWGKGEAEDLSAIRSTEYGPAFDRFLPYALAEGKKGLTAERLGESIRAALTARRPRVRYAVVPQRFKIGRCRPCCPGECSTGSSENSSGFPVPGAESACTACGYFLANSRCD